MKPVQIESLCKWFRGKKGRRVEALQSLSLELDNGEVLGFLGPNGAGKSTTIKILTGQISPTSGTARLHGVSTHLPTARTNLGYLPENPSFFQYLTAREYLRLVGGIHGMERSVIEQASGRVLDRLNLTEAANRPLKGYSKGMVQRLGLAQALLHDPDLYVFDEPMSGLDPVGRALVKEIIQDLKDRGKTVFFSTHITSDVEQVCDRVAILVGGQLKALADVQGLLSKGIQGYRIYYREQGGGTAEKDVGTDDLKVEMQKLLATDAQVERLEPVRQNLEDFFLDTLKGAV